MELIAAIIGAILAYVFGGLLEKHKFALKKQELLLDDYKKAFFELLKIKNELLWLDRPELPPYEEYTTQDLVEHIVRHKKSLINLLKDFPKEYEYLIYPQMEMEISEIINCLENLKELDIDGMDTLSPEDDKNMYSDIGAIKDKFLQICNKFKKKIIFEKD
jgi:hypothetical protein